MPLNLFINRTLYIVLLGILIFIALNKPKGIIFSKYHFILSVLIFTFIIGFSLAYFQSIRYSPTLVFTDMLRSVGLPIGLAIAGWKLRFNPKYERYIIWGMFFFEVFSFTASQIRIPIIGAIFKWSTAQQTNTAICGFYALFLISRKKYLLPARLAVAVAWISAIISLSKWQFFPGLCFPILWSIFESDILLPIKRKRNMLPLFAAIVAIFAIIIFRDEIVNFSSISTDGKYRYNSFEEYWYTRVAKKDPSSKRFAIWSEMMGRLNNQPLTGLGFGVISHTKVNEHNLFVFILTRFGYPIGSFYIYIFILQLLVPLRNKYIHMNSKITLSCLFLYFIITASVGEIYSQLLNCLTLGVVINQLLNFELYLHRNKLSFYQYPCQ